MRLWNKLYVRLIFIISQFFRTRYFYKLISNPSMVIKIRIVGYNKNFFIHIQGYARKKVNIQRVLLLKTKKRVPINIGLQTLLYQVTASEMLRRICTNLLQTWIFLENNVPVLLNISLLTRRQIIFQHNWAALHFL